LDGGRAGSRIEFNITGEKKEKWNDEARISTAEER
jgi:hypothetical protein